MNVFVQVWTEIDPTLNVRVDRRSGDAVAEDGDVLYRVSPLGRAAIAAALAISPANVTAFSVGRGHFDALRHALAAGASQAIELTVLTDGDSLISPKSERGTSRDASLAVSAVLATWFEENQAEFVIADRTAGLIAGLLGWSHLAGIDDLKFNSGRLEASRQLGRGNSEIVSARLPSVARLKTLSIKPPYISRARIQAVSSEAIRCEKLMGVKPQKNIELGQLQAARPRTRLGRQAQPTSSRGADRLAALMTQPNCNQPNATKELFDADHKSPEKMADEFVRYLLHHDLLCRPLPLDETKNGRTT